MRPLYKLNPITDQGKRSKKGRLALIKENGQFKTVQRNTLTGDANQLITVFNNGQLVTEYTLDQVRQQALNN